MYTYIRKYRMLFVFFAGVFFFFDCLLGFSAPLTQIPLLGIVGLLATITIAINHFESKWTAAMVLGQWAFTTTISINKYSGIQDTTINLVSVLSGFLLVLVGVFFEMKRIGKA